VEDRTSLRKLLIGILVKKTAGAFQHHTSGKRDVRQEQYTGTEHEPPAVERAATADRVQAHQAIARAYRQSEDAPPPADEMLATEFVVEQLAYGASPEQATLVMELLVELPEDLQTIALRVFQNYSDEEIGAQLGLAAGYVRLQIGRIRKRWKRRIEDG
jgi:DNA-directed RNA polymerase specialized sigma24 family protein